MASTPYRYKRFLLDQAGAAHPSGTDGVLLGAWAGVGEVRSILDIGTGTGIIALFLAQRTENQIIDRITAVDIQANSVACAARNFKNSPWANRLEAVEKNILDFAKESKIKYELIVSNPPFFNAGPASREPARQLSRRTDTLSQDDLVAAVLDLLAPEGRLCLILPPAEGQLFCEKAACKGLYFTKRTEVIPRKGKKLERLLLQFERRPSPFQRTRFAIYERAEQPSADFISLTKDFYLNF